MKRVYNDVTIAAMKEFDEMKKKPETYKRHSTFKNAMAEVTISAIEEADRLAHDPNAKGYKNIDELMAALNEEDEETATDETGAV